MRNSGLALIAVMLVTAFARLWSPQTQPAVAAQQTNPPATPAQSVPAPASSANVKVPSGEFPDKIQEKIRTFFSEESCLDAAHYCVPPAPGSNATMENPRNGIRFVIATVPDPIHSHLAHFFDSAIEAIEQGAFNEGYTFDRAIMPWPYIADSSSSSGASAVTVNIDKKRKPGTGGEAGQASAESFPGLLIFRESELRLTARRGDLKISNFNPQAEPLFIFVVAETPTAGINEDQFRNALAIMSAIRNGDPKNGTHITHPWFGVLGPTFSGSIYSLQGLLQDAANNVPVLPVYGTVMGTSSIHWYETVKPASVQMILFQQDSTAGLDALLKYASDLGYESKDIAVLAEDETAYGSTFAKPARIADDDEPPGKNPPPPPPHSSSDDVLNIFFPREISQLRSEYSKEISNQPATSSSTQQPATNLRMDLEMTGSDDDSVAPYSKPQAPITQEAVMRGIVSELHRHEAKFILLRASDPLDEVFLAGYLRDKYSQARLVVPTPDLLFARADNTPMDGVLGLNTYPLEPAPFNPQCPGFGGGEVFGASHDVSTYNAATALIQELGRLRGDALDGVRTNADDGKKSTSGTYRQSEVSPCSLSPGLWLTVVSGNAIRPVKILQPLPPDALTLFPGSNEEKKEEEDPSKAQRDTRLPLTWIFVYLACIAVMFRHAWLSWTGGDFLVWQTAGQFSENSAATEGGSQTGGDGTLQERAWILWLGGLTLVAIMVLLDLPQIPITAAEWRLPSVWIAGLAWWLPLPGFVIAIAMNFCSSRKERRLAILFILVSIAIAILGIGYAVWNGPGMVLWQQRELDLISGPSSITPLLFLASAFYIWFLYTFRAESLVDWRCPKLPPDPDPDLPNDSHRLPLVFYNLRDTAADKVRKIIHPFSVKWVTISSSIVVVILALPAILAGPGRLPIRSLEGIFFDGVYSLALGAALVMLLATLLRMLELWSTFRVILTAMDRVGLRDAVLRLQGFEWNVIWNPALSVANEGHKLILREIQTLECLLAEIGEDLLDQSKHHVELRKRIRSIMGLREKLMLAVRNADDADQIPPGSDHKPAGESDERVDSALRPNYIKLQAQFAQTAGLLLTSYLVEHWKKSCVSPDSEDCSKPAEGSSSISIKPEIATATLRVGPPGDSPIDPSALSPKALRLAENFVASVYANFLVTVLLSVRGLVFTAVFAYAGIVLSTVSYPLEPAPSLTLLAVALFIGSAGVVGYVYEEMHRDPTLRRMTSTDPGKLDTAFWTKFLAAGLVPLLSLMTSVFPQAGHLLYSFVEPILQALR